MGWLPNTQKSRNCLDFKNRSITKLSPLFWNRISFHKCAVNVIWTGRRMLKLVSKFDCLFTFLFFPCQKKEQVSVRYFYCNHETFSISWRCPKINFTVTVLKTQQAKYSKFDKDFDIRKPVQMTWSVYQSGENKWSEFRIVRYEFGSSVHISIWKSVEGKSRVC